MLDCYITKTDKKVIPIQTIVTSEFSAWLKKQNNIVKNWVTVTGFAAKPGNVCYLGDENGDVQTILLGIADPQDVWSLGALPPILKAGIYSIEKQYDDSLCDLAAIAWGLGHYYFNRYKSKPVHYEPKLLLPQSCSYNHIENSVKATYLIRDMINTPTEDLGPAQLAEYASNLAEEFGAKIKLTIGDDLLKKDFPAIHMVGRASVNAPRLIEIQWGKKSDPHITLVGKGVCFDTGGLDIKPPLMRSYNGKLFLV